MHKAILDNIQVENMNLSRAKPRIVEVGGPAFEKEVLKAKGPVLVEFSAAWSRPCQVLNVVLDEVVLACATRVKVVRVDADDNPELSLWFGVQSIPTLLYFLRGKVHDRIVGTASKKAILSKLRAVFPGGKNNAPDSSTHPNNDPNS